MSPAATPTQPKLRICNEFIKDDNLKLVQCKTRLVEGRCSQRDKHVAKYKTGFCAKNWCEGQNPKTFSGAPAPTCKSWATCPCSCHTMYDQMYAATGMAREVVNNSEYRAPKGQFWMPSPEERIALHASSDIVRPNAPVVVESPLPEAVPVTLRRSYTPTATGRAARGELEAWVKDECDIWVVEQDGTLCTPPYLANEIGRKQGIKQPSVGAISAVFDRWVKIGFANIEKKPTRFISYTDQGIRLGLEGCKDKAKRAKRSAEAEAGRRIGR